MNHNPPPPSTTPNHPATDTAPADPGRPNPARRPRRHDTGSISMELAVLAPAAMLLLAFLVLAGRAALLDRAITQAAAAAAREVTSARPQAQAQARAEAGARDELTRQHVGCDTGPTVAIATEGPVVRVTLTCSMSSATTWFTPRTLTAEQLSAADPWKAP